MVDASEGNPFYLEELVSWLLDTGVIVREGDRWEVREQLMGRVEVPSTLRAVLQARLDALTDDERFVLERASVIGRVFWEAAVEAIGQQSLETAGVGEVLNRLRHRGLVHRRRQSSFAGTGEFVFKHALLRDVTYDSLLKTHRSDYHRRAATWMEDVAESTRRGDQYAGLIARHHELAGSDAPAASWYRRAGAHAASVFALAEATRLATNGLDLVTDSDPALRFDLLAVRQQVLDRVGDRRQQDADLAAMELLLPQIDPARHLELLIAEANRAYRVSDYGSQESLARHAVDTAQRHGLASAEAQLLLGKALVWAGDYPAAHRVLEQALETAHQEGDTRAIAEGHRTVAHMSNNQGEFAAAIEHLEAALATYRQMDDRDGEARTLGTLGTVFYKLGRYNEARSYHESALSFFTESGHQLNRAVTLGNIAEIEFIQGDLGAARRIASEGLELCDRLGDREGMGLFHSTLGSVYRRVAMLDEAKSELEAALAIADEVGLHWLAASTLVDLALVHLSEGPADLAASQAADAIGRALQADSPIHTGHARLALGRALGVLGEFDRAQDELSEAAAIGAQLDLGYLVAEATSGLATVAADRGEDRARCPTGRTTPHRTRPFRSRGLSRPGRGVPGVFPDTGRAGGRAGCGRD